MVSKLIVIASLFTLAAAKPFARHMTVHESRNNIPPGFEYSGPADADSPLNLRIGLVQGNPDALIDALYDVSTPSSALYGQHLSKEEVENLVAPKPETVDAVNAWLKDADVNATVISPAGDWLNIQISVGKAKELFSAEFGTYTHTPTGKQAIRTMAYSIPAGLQGHIDLVHPTINFPNLNSRGPVVSTLGRRHQPMAPCNSASVTPTCVQALYDIPATLATQPSNKLGVSGFIEQFANHVDLENFLKKTRPDLHGKATTFALQTLDGGHNNQTRSAAGLEANLDIQYTVGVASGVPVTFISVGENFHDGDLEGFLDIINFLLSESQPPQVLTTSYGDNESDISRSLANKLCHAYAQLGARGTSVLFASGDGGVAGAQDETCSKFVPTFPSGCPFMTSVGATNASSYDTEASSYDTEASSYVIETAANFSSGGFSNYFGMPSYQAAAVESYLSDIGSTNSGKFNKTGRAYPDVAAIGVNVEIAIDGEFGTLDGTSCASPIFASVIALINDDLIAAGKSPLGFLNPFLYSNPEAFHDITSGSNPGCNTNGFPARSGWDPVTGLGTPNFPALRKAAGL